MFQQMKRQTGERDVPPRELRTRQDGNHYNRVMREGREEHHNLKGCCSNDLLWGSDSGNGASLLAPRLIHPRKPADDDAEDHLFRPVVAHQGAGNASSHLNLRNT